MTELGSVSDQLRAFIERSHQQPGPYLSPFTALIHGRVKLPQGVTWEQVMVKAVLMTAEQADEQTRSNLAKTLLELEKQERPHGDQQGNH